MADSRLRTGLYLFSQQFGALFKKNVILAQRKKRSTVTQLFGSFIFVFLLFCVVKINNLIDDNDPKSLPIRPFFLAANLFVFMFQINSLVTEKETKRRQVFIHDCLKSELIKMELVSMLVVFFYFKFLSYVSVSVYSIISNRQ